MKRSDAMLKEYVATLTEDQLYHANTRFAQKLCGDRAELAEIIQDINSVNKWLLGAKSADEWFNMFDLLGDYVKREVIRRSHKEEIKV